MIILLILVHIGLFTVLLANARYLLGVSSSTIPTTFPRLSILIPARNEATNLPRLLSSLFGQTYPDFEVIVYDDGSEDDTWHILQSHQDPRLVSLRGEGPPPGWVGKVHALFQASQKASGNLFLFLDADTELLHPDALKTMVGHYLALPQPSVMTGITRLRGGGSLLVSLVTNALLTTIPWSHMRRLPVHFLGALNGQCWMIDAATYQRLAPHEHLKNAILEDVEIGRYLKSQGIIPALRDLQGELAVYMYRNHREAWAGFRKNAYLVMGGRVYWYVLFAVSYFATYLLAPFLWPGFWVSLYMLKGLTDRMTGFPWWVTLLTPVSFALGSLLQLHSALSHWTGRVTWKGRRVG